MVTGHHPTHPQLQDFVNGRLGAEASAAIERHLQDCPDCLAALATSTEDDPLLKLAREARQNAVGRDGMLPSGTWIDGYELLEELGRGGMGSVYRAYDPLLKRDVALKLIPYGHREEYYQRLRTEAETIASMQHPGIVRIFHIGQCAHGLYLVLELLHPGGLKVLPSDRQRDVRWAASIVKQVAESIGHAHREGVIHRDLKPDNILLAPDGNSEHPWESLIGSGLEQRIPEVKVTDFGLAKCLHGNERVTCAGVMMGTPGYMAPEQLPDSGDPVGPGADIYALGVILYQLLSGRLPFESDSLERSLRMLRNDEPPTLQSLDANIPEALDIICQACLMKRPDARYPTAQALADDLGRFLQGEPLALRSPTLRQRVARWIRRKPLLAAHFGAIVFFYAMHLIAMSWLGSPQHSGFFHVYLSILFSFWLLAIGLAQTLYDSRGHRRLGEYVYALFTVLLCPLALAADSGPASAPVMVYLFIVVGAVFIRPEPAMVWIQTGLAVVSYLALTAFAWLWRPEHRVSPEHTLLFTLSLPMMGALMHLILRRAQG
jgi:serine/threonine protein kinase